MRRAGLVNWREIYFLEKKYAFSPEVLWSGRRRPQKAALVKAKPKKPKTRQVEDLLTGSNAPAEISSSLESQIGNEVRKLRKELELTVAELGTSAGISTGMLSKIENGSISASLATLSALSKALNVPISRFFRETEERRDCSFVKAGSGVNIERRGTKSGHHYNLLGHSIHGELGVEPYLITLNEDAEAYTNFRHAGVEMIYMLSGKVRYRHADQTYLMEPGDTLFFDAAARHGPEELVKAPMTYLSVIIYPRRS
ncbi:transcriptional regulator with XRE-family HTH domain [Nitrobacteraceae bacterium AZCC 2161]